MTKDQAIVIRQRIIKPAVWEWIEETKKRATSLGYSESYFGRRIWNEDLTASERWKREAALREAVNAEVQGTAADVKKIADARIWREKTARRMRSRFILMVHDELVVESPEEEVGEMDAIMETIAPRVVEWQVPLKDGRTLVVELPPRPRAEGEPARLNGPRPAPWGTFPTAPRSSASSSPAAC